MQFGMRLAANYDSWAAGKRDGKRHARILPSLKTLFDINVGEITKDKQGNENNDIEAEQVRRLNAQIDKKLREAQRSLSIYQAAKDTSG